MNTNLIKVLFLTTIATSSLQSSETNDKYTVIVCSVKNIENANKFIDNKLNKNNSIFIIKNDNRYRISYGNFNTKKEAVLFKKRLNNSIKSLQPYIKILNQKNIVSSMIPKEYKYALAVSNCSTLENSIAFIKEYIPESKAKVTIYKVKDRFITTYGEFKKKEETYIFKNILPLTLKSENPYPVIINDSILNKDNIVSIKNSNINSKDTVIATNKVVSEKKVIVQVKVNDNAQQHIAREKYIQIKEKNNIPYQDNNFIYDTNNDNTFIEDTLLDTQLVNYFIGINYLNSKININESGSVNIGTTTYNLSSNSLSANRLGLKFGLINDTNRYSISMLKQNKRSGVDYSATRIGYDYLFSPNDIYVPYVGIGVGKGKLTNELFGTINIDEYILQIGMIVNMINNIEVEAGVEYSKLSSSTSVTNGTGVYKGDAFTNLNAVSESENTTSVFIGINYKF